MRCSLCIGEFGWVAPLTLVCRSWRSIRFIEFIVAHKKETLTAKDRDVSAPSQVWYMRVGVRLLYGCTPHWRRMVRSHAR